MVTTYAEYMKANPDAVIIGGRDLDHDMEYDEKSGWEICNRCGGQENEIDDTCPDSAYAAPFVADWEEYEEISPGVARHRLEGVPDSVINGVKRYRVYGETGALDCFFHLSTPDRKEVDAWLVETQHPLASEPGTQERRFKSIVMQLAG